jgi:hypothetical protein
VDLILAQVGGTILGPGPRRGLLRERDQARAKNGSGQFPDGNNVFFTILISSLYYANYSSLYYAMKINIF